MIRPSLNKNQKQNSSTKKLVTEPSNDTPQIIRVKQIKQNFKKNVEDPILSMEDLQSTKSPSRCLVHNAILTLYCEIDRKPLCANCMYQQDTHRKHRVIPIGKSMQMIKEDIVSFQIKLEGNLSHCTSISRKLQENMAKNEQQFPVTIEKLKDFYASMIKMLKTKEKEHIAQVLQQKQRIKKEMMFLEQEVKFISNSIASRVRSRAKIESQDNIIYRRGILETLTKASKIIHSQISDFFPDDGQQKMIDFNLFNDIYELVKTRMVLTLPGLNFHPKVIKQQSVLPVTNNTSSSPIKNVERSKSRRETQARLSVSGIKKQRKQVTFDL